MDGVWPSVGRCCPLAPRCLSGGDVPCLGVPTSDHARVRQACSGRRAPQVPPSGPAGARERLPPSGLRSSFRWAMGRAGCRLHACGGQRGEAGALGPVAFCSPPGAWAGPSGHRPGSRGSGALYRPPGGCVPLRDRPGPAAANALTLGRPSASGDLTQRAERCRLWPAFSWEPAGPPSRSMFSKPFSSF